MRRICVENLPYDMYNKYNLKWWKIYKFLFTYKDIKDVSILQNNKLDKIVFNRLLIGFLNKVVGYLKLLKDLLIFKITPYRDL